MIKITDYIIHELNYKKPHIVFDTIERGYMPSLLTGEGPKDISKESIIGIKPIESITINKFDQIWPTLLKYYNESNYHLQPSPINRLGGVCYLSYEALHSIENIKKGTEDHFQFPYLNIVLYSEFYYFRNDIKKMWHITINYNNRPTLEGLNHKDSGFKVTDLEPDFNKKEYINNVKTIKDYITQGEVYEVNLTQGITGKFTGSPYSLYKNLYNINKAPYSAYLERENYSVICNSPELFLKAEKNRVETRPIKGTAPRSTDKKEDTRLKNGLLESEKDQAELFMIVDLMRNDLSKVCKVGSVKVIEKKRLEQYKNVHHLVSIIEGELTDSSTYIDLLKSTFPGGSITGCPKVRCMGLTEEIEKSSRNLYTGTIFLMNQEYLNSNIVIRCATIKDDKIVLNSGGAITIDSDPESEYLETKIKLESIFKVVGNEGSL